MTDSAVGRFQSVKARIGTSVLAMLAVASGLAIAASGFEEFQVASPERSSGQTITLLPDGRWLYVGGRDTNGAITGSVAVAGDVRPPLRAADVELQLAHPRAHHTATVLPDGSVLVFGGEAPDGTLVETAEIIDASRGLTRSLRPRGLYARKSHSATLLTTGEILVVGGVGADGAGELGAQLWNPDSSDEAEYVAPPVIDRWGHAAALLASGKGLIWGGHGAAGETFQSGELFDPQTRVFEPVEWFEHARLAGSRADLGIEETLPAQEADDVPVDVRIAVRFSERVDVTSVGTSTVSLVGPSGRVKGAAVAAEAGRLLFFTPNVDLWPGTTYTLFLKGMRDRYERKIPTHLLTFTTKDVSDEEARGDSGGFGEAGNGGSAGPAGTAGDLAGAALTDRDGEGAQRDERQKPDKDEPEDLEDWEDWIPQREHRTGHWRLFGVRGVSAPKVHSSKEPLLAARSGATAISGRVSKLNGRPLRGVRVSLGSIATETDVAGRFLLSGVPAGSQQLEVDAAAVFSKGWNFGRHFIHVNVAEGRTTTLERNVYLSRINPASEISIASPTTREVVLTHPLIPGLEIRLPKGTIVRDAGGKIVNKISITPVPVDRAPTDVPSMFPVYFTMQPAGAVIENKDPAAMKAVRVRYPNYPGVPAGTRVNFWNYDGQRKGWYVYGHGKVTADGASVEPDAGTGEYFLMPFGWSVGNTVPAPAAAPPAEGACLAGDPVDCATGLFLHQVTDVYIKDVIPIAITRTYRPNDPVSRAFGPGTSHPYDMYLFSPAGVGLPSEIHLILADGGRVKYFQSSGGIWRSASTPGAFHGSTLRATGVPGEPEPPHRMEITLRDQTVLFFEAHTPNRFLGMRDRFGNTLTITRDGDENAKISRITTSNGRYVDFAYGTSTCQSQMTTPSEPCITAITDNIGRTVTYDYYPAGDPAAGRLKKVTDQNGKFETYTYDANGRMEKVFDKRANDLLPPDQPYPMVVNEYYTSGYADGRVKKQTLPDGATWQFEYDQPSGDTRRTTITDPRGLRTERLFNADNYLIREIRAPGTSVEQTYVYERDPVRQLLLSVTDPLNRTTKFDYDTSGRLLSVARMHGTAAEAKTSYMYHSNGQMATVTDPLGHTTRFGYDELGSLASVTDPLSHVTSLTSNHQGLPSTITNALDKTWRIKYAQGDIASITDPPTIAYPLGRTTNVFSDSVGRPMSVVNALGNRSMYKYDGRDRVKEVTDALSGLTKVEYDANGNVEKVTDPRDLAPHVYGYDRRNRLVSYRDPLNPPESYEYLEHLNQVRHTDGKLQTTLLAYDSLGRLEAITYHDGSTVSIRWDAGNRPLEVIDSVNGTIRLQYDDLARSRTETTPEGTVTHTYDAAGRPKTMSIAGGPQNTYNFDDADRLLTILRGADTISKAYDDANRQTSLTYPNGVVTSYGYSASNELESITYTSGANVIGAIAYTYDAGGRRITRNSTPNGSAPTPAVATTVYDAANQLTQWGSQTVLYDSNGNMTSDGTNTFVWNVRNQLVSVTNSGGTTSYTYDAFGRRRSIAFNGATPRFFQYDGANVVRERLNGSPVNDLWTGLGLDETFSISAGGPLYLSKDALNSTTLLTNASAGAWVKSYHYDAYGNATSNDNPSWPGLGGMNTQQYTGRDNDNNGLHYMRARYYNPKFGRFVSSDPIGLAGGLNTHAYALGDPVSLSDPTGLHTGFDDLVFIAGGAAAGLIGQGLSDLYSGQSSGWEDYLGSAVGGAAFGETLLYFGPVAAGLVGGAVTNATKQGLKNLSGKQCGFNPTAFAFDTAVGGLTGLLPGLPRIPGVNSGRGSFNAIYRQMTTKLANGSISRVSGSTAVSMFGGRFYNTGGSYGVPGGAFAGAVVGPLVPGYSDPCACQ